MATGFVFVYLAIVALAAPLLWLIWWSFDSLANRPVSAYTPIRAPRPAKAAYPAPHGVDISLAVRPDKVTVYSKAGQELSTCDGPDAGGRCSRPLADGSVPCAGCLLALPRPIRGSLEWQIPSGYRACLLGSYTAFRQGAPAT